MSPFPPTGSKLHWSSILRRLTPKLSGPTRLSDLGFYENRRGGWGPLQREVRRRAARLRSREPTPGEPGQSRRCGQSGTARPTTPGPPTAEEAPVPPITEAQRHPLAGRPEQDSDTQDQRGRSPDGEPPAMCIPRGQHGREQSQGNVREGPNLQAEPPGMWCDRHAGSPPVESPSPRAACYVNGLNRVAGSPTSCPFSWSQGAVYGMTPAM
ncbi:MAG: hypothetical protein JWN86_2 [Planctomycetota bacterium]|nr:hypothetical protein [Planctomycetota bacterium]